MTKEKNTDFFEKLRKHVYKLHKLLELGNPGHFSLCIAIAEEWKAIAELWFKPEKASIFSIEYLFHDKWYTSYYCNKVFFTSHKAAEDYMKDNKGFLPLRVQGYAKVPETKK